MSLETFLEMLDPNLKLAIIMAIYKKTFETHSLLTKIKNKRLLSFMGSRLKPHYS